ncbi:hypothetical protein [Leifsonia sp. fls2-241-R2A-40a]|uniref:hypothetical protein n=1 Tax=Leifsonia sp. fls2-241-R2A-40a TaxID=3040290 RepID=UPI00254FAB69|nr:hypothetical protein [Leifsonia sp. fls2-241-R2A-40a]
MVAEERDDSGGAGGFDPRYDATFQRGYQPQPGERQRTRVRSDAPDAPYRRPSSLVRGRDESAPALPSEPVSPYEAAALALADDRVATVGDDPMTRSFAEAAPGASVPAGGPSVWDRLDLNPRRNPIVLALWVIGGGFVVLGIVLYCISVTSSYSGPTPSTDVGSLVFAQLGWMLASPLITVGLLTLVGLLFLTVLAGRRTRDESPGDDEV